VTIEIPAPKMSKDEFLQRIETVTAAYGFERHKDRFIRMPEGYFLAQEIDFHWGRSVLSYFSGQPYFWLRLRKRAMARTRAVDSSFAGLLADFGTMLDVDRANFVSYYGNMGDGLEWIDDFDRVLGAVVANLDIIMRNKPLLLLYLRNDPTFRLRPDLIARVAELPENSQGG
jgi:hypothetical protein